MPRTHPPKTPTPDTDFVRFSTDWKIKWARFDGIKILWPLEKCFNTSYDNVVLRWITRLAISFDGGVQNDKKVSFSLQYLAGPLEKLKDMEYSIAIVKPDRSTQVVMAISPYEAIPTSNWGWRIFEDKDGAKIRAKYGLSDMELIYRITLKIPISAFTLEKQLPPTTTPPQWMIDLHDVVDDPEKSSFWNAKLISRDKSVFYCNKIIGYQSKKLEDFFNQPPAEGELKDEYEFPALATESMKVFIKYLYTGEAILGNLSIDRLIELVDTAGNYDLKSLKQACIFELWQKVVKEPGLCYRIIRFSDSHDDLKYLKDRAMDILVEKFDDLEANSKDLVREFGGGVRGKKLHKEFTLF